MMRMRRLLPLLLVASSLVPVTTGDAGTPFTLYFGLGPSDPSGGCRPGTLVDAVPPADYPCVTIPSTVHLVAREKVVSLDFTQTDAFPAATTLGDHATVDLDLSSFYPFLAHPLLVVNATLDLVDGATTSRIGWAEIPCPFIPLVTSPRADNWGCSLTLPLLRSDAPAGSFLRVRVTFPRDETAIAPAILLGDWHDAYGPSRVEFPG